MSAADWLPRGGVGIDGLRSASLGCEGCHLHESATQTVFSRGPETAPVVFVGEQPGDIEDRRGEPFVGPAGKLLDRAVEEAGIDPAQIYTTNAVKHFKFTMSGPGKRRIHQSPDAAEIAACRPWLLAEFAVLDPVVVVALGAVAAKALFGPNFRVTKSRGILLSWPASAGRPQDFRGLWPATADPPEESGGWDEEPDGSTFAIATLHPSAVLRADDTAAAMAGLVADLRVVAQAIAA